jgi:hypothetical protein
VAAVTRELRAVGIAVYRRPEDCVPDIVAVLTNVLSSGPRQKILRNERVTDQQGIVVCDVLKQAPPRTEDQPRKIIEEPGVTGSGIDFVVGNVECTVYPSDGKEAEQLGRLRRALAALTRFGPPALRP